MKENISKIKHNSKSQNENTLNNCVKILALFALAFISMFTLFNYFIIPRTVGIEKAYLTDFNQGWLDDDGNEVTIPSTIDNIPLNTDYAIHNTLPVAFKKQMSITFVTYFSNVDVYIDGDLLYSLRKPNSQKYLNSPTSIRNVIDIPQGSNGKSIDIVYKCPYKTYNGQLHQISFSATSGIDDALLSNGLPKFAISTAVVFIGVAIMLLALVSIVIGRKQIVSVFWFSIFFIAMGVFSITDNTVFRYLIQDNLACVLIEKMSLTFAPIPYLIYIIEKYGGRFAKICRIIAILQCGILTTLTALVVSGVYDLVEISPFICTNIIVIIYILLILKFFRRENMHIALLFFVFITLAISHYERTNNIDWTMYMVTIIYYIVECYTLAKETKTLDEGMKASQIKEKKAHYNMKSIQIANHFVFHVINDIRVLTKIDPDRAYDSLGDFAKFLRAKTDAGSIYENIVPFKMELDSVKAYCNLQQLLLSDRLQVIYDTDDCNDFCVPLLSIQIAVENAIEHGIKAKQNGGTVKISSKELDNWYEVKVIDNGVGFDPTVTPINTDHISVANKNVTERLKYYGNNEVDIISHIGVGTEITFRYNKQLRVSTNETEIL